MSYLRNRPFIVVDFISQPKPTVDTRVRGWADDQANWQTKEQFSIVDRIGRKQQSAKIVIDIVEAKVVTNRTVKTDDEILEHYVNRYSDHIEEALTAWAGKRVMEELKAMGVETEDATPEDVESIADKVVG